MRTHLKVIAWLHIVFGSLFTLACFGASAFLLLMSNVMQSGGSEHEMHSAASGANEAATFAWGLSHSMGMTGWIMMAVALIGGGAGIVVGIGLLRMTPWSRVMGIVVSILDILMLNPLYIALGIYGLVILFDKETVALLQEAGPVSAIGATPSG